MSDIGISKERLANAHQMVESTYGTMNNAAEGITEIRQVLAEVGTEESKALGTAADSLELILTVLQEAQESLRGVQEKIDGYAETLGS